MNSILYVDIYLEEVMLKMDETVIIEQEILKVVGVGGGGGNAVNRMLGKGSSRVEYIVMNTDAQALGRSEAPFKLQLGPKQTKGRGAGADPEIGQRSAEESEEQIKELLTGADMVFLTAGMGGGTGTGAIPVVARVAKDLGILTVAIVTKPFTMEGMKKMRIAEAGIEELKKYVDTLIVIPNDKIYEICPKDTKMIDAFEEANQILKNGVAAITDIIEVPGEVNVDFADVRKTIENKGIGLVGIGTAKGENRAMKAVTEAINSPFIDTTIEGAESILISISAGDGGPSASEFQEIQTFIMDCVNNEEVDLIPGMAVVDELGDEIKIAVIATGFLDNKSSAQKSNDAVIEENDEEKEDKFAYEDFAVPDWLNHSDKRKK